MSMFDNLYKKILKYILHTQRVYGGLTCLKRIAGTIVVTSKQDNAPSVKLGTSLS